MRFKVVFQDSTTRIVSSTDAIRAVSEAQQIQLSYPNACLILSSVEQVKSPTELADLEIIAYKLSENLTLKKVQDKHIIHSEHWVIVRDDRCLLNCEGKWEFNIKPSARTRDFIARTRFNSAQRALTQWNHA